MHRTDLWRKLTVVWPLAISDAFWTLLGLRPQFLEALTLKRVVWTFAFVALVMAFAFAGVFTLDMVVPFIGDLLVYFDVVSFVVMMAAHRQIRTLVRAAARTAQPLIRRGADHFARARLRLTRPRTIRPRSASTGRTGDDAADGPGWMLPSAA